MRPILDGWKNDGFMGKWPGKDHKIVVSPWEDGGFMVFNQQKTKC